jgi:hypothetical protein
MATPTRLPSADPMADKRDEMSADEIIAQRDKLEREGRRYQTAHYTYRGKKELSIIQSRIGHTPLPKKVPTTNRSNLTPFELNHYVRERYAPRFPVYRQPRQFNIPTNTGKTALEITNRRQRGNKKVVRRRRKKKSM